MFVSGEYRELLSPQTKLQVLYPGLRGGGEGPLGRPHDVELPDDAAVHPPALVTASYRAAPHTSLSSHLDVGHRAAALADHELVEEDVLGDGEPGALGEEVVPDQTPQSSLQLSDLHPGQSLSQAATLQRVS